MSRSRLGMLAALIGLGPVVFAIATLMALSRGEAQMRASDVAFDEGDLERALRHARAAAVLYVPGAEHVDQAHARLRAIAIGAERARDLELARFAWRAVRGAAIETTHAWVPRAAELAEAEQGLERLGVAVAGLPGVQRVTAPHWVALLAGAFLLVAWSLREILGGAFSDAAPSDRRSVFTRALLLAGSLSLLCLALLRA